MKKPSNKKEFFNKKARFDYIIFDTFEAGVILTGDEIKTIRAGRVDMTSSYAKIINGEVYWLGGNFNLESSDCQRTRKLLLHKEQINKLIGKTAQLGYTLIPIKLYLTRGKAKIELGIGRGKKEYEKRDAIKKREQQREIKNKLRNF
jgi:SsrA-binding protein